jgi:hypothetical protein
MIRSIFQWLGFLSAPAEQGPLPRPPRGGSGGKPDPSIKPRKCKNCGKPLRGLANAPEIPVHVADGSRFCWSIIPTPSGTLFAEWPDCKHCGKPWDEHDPGTARCHPDCKFPKYDPDPDEAGFTGAIMDDHGRRIVHFVDGKRVEGEGQ